MEVKKINLQSLDNQPSSPSVNPKTDQPSSLSNGKKKNLTTGLLFVLVAIIGIASGGLVKNFTTQSASLGEVNQPTGGSIKVGEVFGSDSESLFPDSAVGVLEKGGIDGEGTHHLLRPGGVSQTIYLTSSVIDLDEFEGHKITVWGETFEAQKAGWLMDVGRVKVEELNAEAPTE